MKEATVLAYMVKNITNIKKLVIILFIALLSNATWPYYSQKTVCFNIKTFSFKEKTFFQLLDLKLKSFGYQTIHTQRCLLENTTILTNYHSDYHNFTNPVYFFDFKSSKQFNRPPLQNNYVEFYTNKKQDPTKKYINLDNPHLTAIQIAKDIQQKNFQNNYFKITLLTANGIGNQLFNYAAGYAYAKRYNKKTFLENQQSSITEAFDIPEKNLSRINKLFYLKNFNNPLKSTSHLNLNKNLFLYNNYSALSLYHQSYWNFHDAVPQLQERLKFKPFTNKNNIELAKKMQSENSVSIHIRLGDYVAQKYPLLIYSNYYENAINYILKHVTNPVFYVFTNDPQFVQQKFKPNVPYTLVTGNNGSKSFRDMQLMSLCKHNIIANSSFSWWGALLNTNENKIVIYPDTWLSWDENWLEYMRVPNWIEIPTDITKNEKNQCCVYPKKDL